MKSITCLLKNLKNLLPYFLLVAIYFFFVNLEARKEERNNLIPEEGNIIKDGNSSIELKNPRIKIPVIPYSQ